VGMDTLCEGPGCLTEDYCHRHVMKITYADFLSEAEDLP
jgi:hypothetical protein